MEMEYVAIGYMVVCAVIALFNPFSLKGNPVGRYLARFMVCLVATPVFYFFLLGSTVASGFDPKNSQKDWQTQHSR